MHYILSKKEDALYIIRY